MLIIAHRGGNRVFPENSVDAINHSFQIGADVAELDVRLSKDSVPVVIHDDNLNRLFLLDKDINELDSTEMLSVKYSNQNRSSLATLEWTLEKSKNFPLLIHIKDKHEGILQTLGIVERRGLSLRVIVGVTSLDALRLVKTKDPNIRTLGFISSPKDISDFIAAGVEIIRLWDSWITKRTIDLVHGYGKPVWVMTGDPQKDVGETSSERLLQLKNLGIDGVLVNDVSLAVRTLKPTAEGVNLKYS